MLFPKERRTRDLTPRPQFSNVSALANLPVNPPCSKLELVNLLDKITEDSTFENLATPAAILVISRQIENTFHL
jgi:hypothetical protein